MKRLSYINTLIVLISMILTVGCESILDVQPSQSVEAKKSIKTANDVKNLLIGAYEGIKGTGTGELFGNTFNTFSELLAIDLNNPDARFRGTFSTLRDAEAKALTSFDADVTNTWIRAYDVINTINQVLDHLDLLDSTEVNRIQGEALGLRGTLYFELTRFWGRQFENNSDDNTNLGVPIVLTPVYEAKDAVKVARSSVKACYDRAIQDLTDSKNLLSSLEKNGDYFSTYAASAILSRIYLQQGDYLKAANEANLVIESQFFTIAAKPLLAYNNKNINAEYVLTFMQNATSNAGESNSGLATFYASLFGTGRGDIRIQERHLAKYEPGDLRGGEIDGYQIDSLYLPNGKINREATIKDVKRMFYMGVGNNSGYIYSSKWADARANIAVVRLAEMYLTRAEANFESGAAQVGPNTPLEDINIIRRRAELSDLAAVDRDIIRNERYLELCWEGFRLHDLRRWRLNIITYMVEDDYPDMLYDAPELVLPIPHREMIVNDLLVQNTGY